MIDNFNRILRAFGAHRVQLVDAGKSMISFEILPGGSLAILYGGEVVEKTDSGWDNTPRSKWIQAIGQGKTRNDAGEMA